MIKIDLIASTVYFSTLRFNYQNNKASYKPMQTKKVSTLKVFKSLVWPRRYVILIGLALLVISKLAALVLPWATRYLFDNVIVHQDSELLLIISAWVLGAIAVQSITSYILTRILSIEAHRIIAKLRVQVQEKVLSLPMHFFDQNKSGVLVRRIMNDVDGVRDILGTGLIQLIGGMVTTVVSLLFLFSISWELTLYVSIPAVLTGIIYLKSFTYLRPLFRKRREVNATVQGRLTETLGGIAIVKGYNSEKPETEVFEKGVYRIFKYVKKTMNTQALVNSVTGFLAGLAFAIVMWIGGNMVIQDELTIGEFLSFTLFLAYGFSPLIQIGRIGSLLTDAFSGLDRTEELMNLNSEADDEERTIVLKDLVGHIEFKDVVFSYNEGKEVLKGININMQPGSVTALVGTSGGGKSTIAGLVASHFSADEGTVLIDGSDLSKVVLNSYRSQLGMVLQNDFLFEGTIKENILFSKPDASIEALNAAVKSAYVDEFTDRFEDGIDTRIGERGVKLSGGQRQRVSIARALLADPKILILDEATSNLDVESELMIQQSLNNLLNGRTTLVIAHRLSTIQKANQILVIDEGMIKETGTHDELIEKKGTYFDLFTLQSKI
ncbi:MAG: subfamily B ATP-binding cassette protein MsbA [Crocinitomicaceae bacterium]